MKRSIAFMNRASIEVLIIGAGITGIAAGIELEDNAIILEKDAEPGGLIKSFQFDDGYWFDSVLHLFHIRNQIILDRINGLTNSILEVCPPVAWIECKEGTVRYPFQLNLGSLVSDVVINCIKDFAEVEYGSQTTPNNSSYKNYLERTYGKTMCELFYFPYNEKFWKDSLSEMSCDGQLWNLHKPSFEEVLEGALFPGKSRETYNTNAYYPRPPKNSPKRCMGVLTEALAQHLNNLHLQSEVISIDTKKKQVRAKCCSTEKVYHYSTACISTIPLPKLLRLCSSVPKNLIRDFNKLKWNKVISVAFSIEGERPIDPGHWRYYTDPDVPFTRLIFMTEFDKNNAPESGWGLLIEITELSDTKLIDKEILFSKIESSLKKIGLLKKNDKIIGKHLWVNDPAYVAFTKETSGIVSHCMDYLRESDIYSAGRYGNWEYSSMAENLEDGFRLGGEIKKKI
jgi:protoporphyrinogen oxidase